MRKNLIPTTVTRRLKRDLCAVPKSRKAAASVSALLGSARQKQALKRRWAATTAKRGKAESDSDFVDSDSAAEAKLARQREAPARCRLKKFTVQSRASSAAAAPTNSGKTCVIPMRSNKITEGNHRLRRNLQTTCVKLPVMSRKGPRRLMRNLPNNGRT
jgi:hypothetical protein